MRVLVVEDDMRVAAALRRGLQAEGFAVDTALDGLDGLWHATEHPYDLIVLDLLLPGKNGFQVCGELRAAGDWTPILILTAKDGEYDKTEALDTGADAYLTKPFSFAVLMSTVRALLRRSSVTTPEPFVVLDLTLDVAKRRCWRDEREIGLTSREFSILELLVRHAGSVLTKRDIIGGVWDYDFDGDPNIVEVYIGRLRRKIDGPATEPLIETVRGAGYRLRDGT